MQIEDKALKLEHASGIHKMGAVYANMCIFDILIEICIYGNNANFILEYELGFSTCVPLRQKENQWIFDSSIFEPAHSVIGLTWPPGRTFIVEIITYVIVSSALCC